MGPPTLRWSTSERRLGREQSGTAVRGRGPAAARRRGACDACRDRGRPLTLPRRAGPGRGTVVRIGVSRWRPVHRTGSRGRASRCAGRLPGCPCAPSTRSCTWTRWARSTTRRASPGAPLAPAPRVRDGDLHDRRDVRPPGLPRRGRADHRRSDAVDDGGRRHPAHRDTARGAGGLRRAVPRHPAVGEPAGQGQDDRARATRAWRPSRSPCSPRRTAGRWSASSPARWPGTAGPARPTRRWRWFTPPSRRAPSCGCRGTPVSTPWSTSSPDPAESGTKGAPRRPAGGARGRGLGQRPRG